MENQEKEGYNAEPETNNPTTGNGTLVSEKTEDVTVDTRKIDREQSGEGEENHGDDFLGKANKTDK